MDPLRRPLRPGPAGLLDPAGLLGLGLVLAGLTGCGDDTVTTVGESASGSESDGTTTTGGTSPSTSATASESASGSATDSESGTTTTTGETTAVSTSAGTTTEATTDATTDATTAVTSEATTDTTTDTTTSDTDTTTSDTDTTTGDTDTTTDTTTGEEPAVCDDASLPYGGALCGPPELPCVVVANEAASPETHFRNEAPAIAFDNECAPRILYSVAENGYHGFYAVREGVDLWTVEPTPFEIARVGLAHDHAADHTLALAYNGAFGTSLWVRDVDQWNQIDAVAGQHIASAHAFARGGDGLLHASLYRSDNVMRYAAHDPGWSLADVAGQATPSTALALDPDDAPHLTLWRTQGPNWELTYAAPPGAPEPLFSLGSNVLGLSAHGIAVIPGDKNPLDVVPYVLHARNAGGGLHGVALSHRVGPGAWTLEDVIVEDDQDASLCAGQPQAPGETCDYDYLRHRPLAIVASAGGDVRFLFSTYHYKGTFAAQCVQNPFPMCFWVGQSDESVGELRIGWTTPQGPEWATLVQGINANDLTLVVDAGGRFHAAIYDAEGTTDPMVRYLAFE
ncbi:MAG: hypothetical protein R3B09_27490 [Nannocystaceae bacterium]